MAKKLVLLPYSPWSEKARFALDHHGVPYALEVHAPVTGELGLRLRLGRPFAKATVPVLFDDREAFTDSLAIAEQAERVGRGSALFPDAHRAEIMAWNAASERALASGRKRVFQRTLADTNALEQNLVGVVPGPLRSSARPIAANAVRYMQAKYSVGSIDANVIETELENLRAALADGRRYLVGGTFTYADIAMAVVLQMVEPVADAHLRIAAHVRRTFRDPELAARFPDLIEWRDRIYDAHRKRRS